MLNSFEKYPEFLIRLQPGQLEEWQAPTLRSQYRERLAHDAGLDDEARRPAQASPLSARVPFDLGVWFIKAGCRLQRLGFGRLGAQSANSARRGPGPTPAIPAC